MLGIRSLASLTAVILYSLLEFSTDVVAQLNVNGQIFTSALAIIDTPAPGSTYHAGSNVPIAIDVSGDGKLPRDAQVPGSGLPTSFDSLELYLFSTEMSLNVTLSNSSILTQEPGSTVKHIDFQLNNCVPAGRYNFSVYEGSHINATAYFSITSIPILVENTNYNGPCSNTNALQSLPQVSSPPPRNPLIGVTSLDSGVLGSSVMTSLAEATVTLTLEPSDATHSRSGSPTPTSRFGTITESVSVTTETVTILLVAVDTIVTTLPGRTIGFTTVVTSVATETVAATHVPDAQGFVPVNTAIRSMSSSRPLFILRCLAFLSLIFPYVLIIQ